MQEIPQHFEKHLKDFDFSRVSIANFYKGCERFNITRQQVSKWLNIYAERKGMKMIKLRSNNTWYYTFKKKNLDEIYLIITKDDLLNLDPNEYKAIHKDSIKEHKLLLKKMKYFTNSVYKIRTGIDNTTRIFRIS